MGVIWSKIWHDLWKDRGRTLQVVVIIAVGAFAIGMIINARNLVIRGVTEVWVHSSPLMIGLAVDPPVDDDMLLVLSHLDGVEDVEGQLTASVEWRLSPDQEWQPGFLTARADYTDQRYAKLELLSGSWPHEEDVAVGQGVAQRYGIREGGSVALRVNDREHTLNVIGTLYNNYVLPPGLGGPAQLYVTRDRFEYLVGERNFNSIMAAAPVYDEVTVRDIANQMQNKLEKAGIDAGGNTPPEGRRYVDPGKHFIQATLDGIFLVMGIMGTLALILGLFLVYNTINAIVSQQVDQIGIMKAIGARTVDILFIYLMNVLMYGLMALLIAVPLGAIGGYGLGAFLLTAMNLETYSLTLSPPAVVAQVAIALLAPLLASLIPLISGARTTVREAISTYGLNASISLVDRLLAGLERIPRLVSLTISNTFRRKGRVILTQISLVLSGLIFMMVMSVRDSATYTFTDVLFSILNYDVTFVFEDAEPIQQVETLSASQPDVKAVEMWTMDGPKARPASRAESDDDQDALLFGVPLPTQLYGPQMRAGRWLRPDDTHAVVLNQVLADDVGVGLGDWVTFNHGVRGETTWQVVGLLFDPILTQSAHVPRDAVLRETHNLRRARTVWIQTVRNDPAGEAASAKRLRQFYEDHQLRVSPTNIFGGQGGDTASGLAADVLGRFALIIGLLLVMAILIGLVGSIALSGVLSLNVLERRREIGVMRAIGASSGSILGLFIGEGLILGWLSWLIALPLSLPAGQAMTKALGIALGGELVYKYTPSGAIYWLLIITTLSVVASWFPARGATRISVRESLAYQ
jgi:putative ABC transport system permease protein